MIPIVLGVLTMGGVAVHAARAAASSAAKAGEFASEAADYLFHRAGTVGAGPEQLFEARVRPVLTALSERNGRADALLSGPAPVVRTLRGAARTSLVLALAVLAVSLFVFAIGFADAFDDVTCVPNPRTAQYCPY
ncbi:hypothetical protein [Streptomyces sp. NBC_00096]|uniref:hypothetical protein n=1 Tax=Streptomyces sp. NBC_00096 TaxID=2975650 RepID=UPI00324B8DA0